MTCRATVSKATGRRTRPWQVDLYDQAGMRHRTRWFRHHRKALRWATRKASA
jgi:hypothetical protein